MKMSNLLALLVMIPGLASATETVCSSSRLYWSDVKFDYGTPPRNGDKLRTEVIAFDGVVLLNYDQIKGLNPFGRQPYRVELDGQPVLLEETGNRLQGSRIFKQTAVLLEYDPIRPSPGKELGRESVVCQSSWRQAI